MVENNYHVLEEDKEVYSDIWDKEKRALINYEVVDLLNKQEETIQKLKRHIKLSMISRITVEDVLGCARDSRFCDNEEIIKAIDCIAKDLGVNLY